MKNNNYKIQAKFLNNDNETIKEVVLTNYTMSLEKLKQDILNVNNNGELLDVINKHLNQYQQLELVNLGQTPYNKPLNINYNSLIYYANNHLINSQDLNLIDYHNDETILTHNDFLDNFIKAYINNILEKDAMDGNEYLYFQEGLKNSSTTFEFEANSKYQLYRIIDLINNLLGTQLTKNNNYQLAVIGYKKINKTAFNDLKMMFFNYKQWNWEKVSLDVKQKVGLLFWQQLKRCFKSVKILKLLDELYSMWNVVLVQEEFKVHKTISILDHLSNQLVVWNVKKIIVAIKHFVTSRLEKMEKQDTG